MSAKGVIVVEMNRDGARARLIERNPGGLSPWGLRQTLANPGRLLAFGLGPATRRPNIAGYKDEEGIFHPIRWDPDYDYRRAGGRKAYATNRSRSARAVRWYLRTMKAAARARPKKAAKKATKRTAKKATKRARGRARKSR